LPRTCHHGTDRLDDPVCEENPQAEKEEGKKQGLVSQTEQ